jgi:hypothetical protein
LLIVIEQRCEWSVAAKVHFLDMPPKVVFPSKRPVTDNAVVFLLVMLAAFVSGQGILSAELDPTGWALDSYFRCAKSDRLDSIQPFAILNSPGGKTYRIDEPFDWPHGLTPQDLGTTENSYCIKIPADDQGALTRSEGAPESSYVS